MAALPEKIRLQEAEALKAQYLERTQMTHADFARQYGLGGASMVWQYLSGHRPLNLTAATRFAGALDIPLESFSHRLAREAIDGFACTKDAMRRRAAAGSGARHAHEPGSVYLWPFPSVSPDKVRRLARSDIAKLDAALIGAANALGLDIAEG